MKYFLTLLLLFQVHNAFAWYCNDVASERNGDTINSCGIGEASSEDEARKLALHNAYNELDLICSRSADCADRALEISPLRTECKKVENIYRCHRGVTATITNEERDPNQKMLLEEVYVPKKVVQIDGTNQFTKSSIVDFDSSPQGSTVFVDGIEVCKTPCTQEINQGEHKVIFERDGFDLQSSVYTVKSGRQTISENLVDTYGYLTIENLPDSSSVKINNKEITAKEDIRLRPNQHVVTVSSKYHQPWHKSFSIKKGERVQFNYDAEPLMAFVKVSALDAFNKPVEAEIYLNGKRMAEKTPAVLKIPSGSTRLTLEYPRHNDIDIPLNLDPDERTDIKKQMKLSDEKDWTIYFGLGLGGSPLKGLNEKSGYSCCVVLDVSLQYMLTKRIAIKASYNYLSGSTDMISSYSDRDELSELNGHQISLALPLYFSASSESRVFLAPEYGKLDSNLTFENSRNLGASTDAKVGQPFYGLFIGKEWRKPSSDSVTYGVYLSGGLRKYSEDKEYFGDTTYLVSGGLMFEF
jgi:PEGA domain